MIGLLLKKKSSVKADGINKTNFKKTAKRTKAEPVRRVNTGNSTVTVMRIPRPFCLIKFRDLVMHINRGLVVNLGNTCAESKGSKAAREVWHV